MFREARGLRLREHGTLSKSSGARSSGAGMVLQRDRIDMDFAKDSRLVLAELIHEGSHEAV